MKKSGIYLIALFCTVVLQAQSTDYPELLSNPGFETATTNNFLGTTVFEDWTMPLGAAVIESDDKVEGNQALKLNKLTQASNILEQEVFGYDLVPEVGATYELCIVYKVLTTQGGEDVALDAFWNSSRDGQLEQDAEVLRTDWFTASDWTTEKVRTTCPEGATRFYFRVKVKKNVVVLFDNFSFRRVEVEEPLSKEPSLSVSQEKLPAVEADINTSVTFPPITVKQANLVSPVQMDVRGAGRAFFSLSQNQTTEAETQLVITYHPTQTGVHNAMVVFESESHPELSLILSVRGICTDPANPPTLTVTPVSLPTFTAVAGKQSTDQLKLGSSGCVDYIYASVRHIDNAGFVVNSTTFIKNMPQDVTVTFHPTKAGYYHSQLLFWSLKTDTVVVDLIGTATAGTDDPATFATVFSWNLSKPSKLLVERFDDVENNFDLQLDGWQNVVCGGERPWWGYLHRDASNAVVERTAKMTGYRYQLPSEGIRCETWLVTPALDYKHAESRIFTLRVMGDFMFDGNDTRLSLWLVDSVPGDRLYFRELEGLAIPESPDYNGEWCEYHINLDGQEIEDVFFMAFKYDGMFGQENAVTYYVDDVSWGRTDLPLLQADSAQVVMTAFLNKDAKSGMISVKAANLTEPVKLSLGGNNKSKFQLSTNTLPPEGGTFFVTFNSDLEGVHEAYLKLSSRGAADVFIPMAVFCKNAAAVGETPLAVFTAYTLGRELYVENADTDYTVYDATGRIVYTGHAVQVTLPSSGGYVVRCASTIRKVTVL